MKKSILTFGVMVALTTLNYGQDAVAKPSKGDTSYAMGMLIGKSIEETALSIDFDALFRGIREIVDKKPTKITLEAANTLVQTAMAEAKDKQGAENAAREATFLAANAKKPGMKRTDSGLQYEIITQGTGPKPVASDSVKVHYQGTLSNGTVFDSSIERGEPVSFPLNGVIPGWTEGLQLMPVGSKYRFYVPSKLAYGPNGAGSKIGPNALLIFEVELLTIEPPNVGK